MTQLEQLEKMRKIMEDLSKGGVSLPGLDPDSIIKNIVKTQYEPLISQFPTKQEGEAFLKEMEDYMLKNGKEEIITEISKIKTSFKQVKDSISQLTIGISSMITSIALPPSIPGVQNPIFSLNEGLSKFNTIKTLLNQANTAVSDMIGSALKLKYPLPQVALSVVGGLATVNNLLNLNFKNKIKEAENAASTAQNTTTQTGTGTTTSPQRPTITAQTSNVVSRNRPRRGRTG